MGLPLPDAHEAAKAVVGQCQLRIGHGLRDQVGQDIAVIGVVVHHQHAQGLGAAGAACRGLGLEQLLGAVGVDAAVPTQCLPGAQMAGVDPALHRLDGHTQSLSNFLRRVRARCGGHAGGGRRDAL